MLTAPFEVEWGGAVGVRTGYNRAEGTALMNDDAQPPRKPRPPGNDDDAGLAGLGWTLAIEFLAYLLVLGYVGKWLDDRYGWGGKGLMGGVLLALSAWIYRVLRLTWRWFK